MALAGTKTSALPRASFELTDHNDRNVTELAFRGRYALVFFGFTHCRVVCPRALTKISGVLDGLGKPADFISALYITVDPERDTSSLMREFLKPFPRFLGLTGSRDQIDAAKKNFRVFARRTDDANEADGYKVPHTAITYLLDPAGEVVAHYNDSVSAQEMAAMLTSQVDPITG